MASYEGSEQPPAKRMRLEQDAPQTPEHLDDDDDDFYDTPNKVSTPSASQSHPDHNGPSSLHGNKSGSPLVSSRLATSAGLPGIPGLGGFPNNTVQGLPSESIGQLEDDEDEDGEVHDDEAPQAQDFINPAASTTANEPSSSEDQLNSKLMMDVVHEPVGSTKADDQDGTLAPESTANPMDALSSLLGLDTDDQPTAAPFKATDDAAFMAAAESNKGNAKAEWQFDSSDAESSDSSDSSSDSSDDEEEEEGVILDPEEAVRILMREEDGDHDGSGSHKPFLKTTNEQEEIYEKPDMVITPEMKITELGFVDKIVENMVLVRGKVSGELYVLESGSVLCLEDRRLVGAVLETLGRVQEPLYSVGFNKPEEITDIGLKEGLPIYFVEEHSTFVFTEPLRKLRGTDASNVHDEEVGEAEVEFSDDEAEAEYKRQQKAAKRARHEDSNDNNQPKNGNQRSTIGSVKQANGKGHGHPDAGYQQKPTPSISYDDEPADDDMYKPLTRPANLHTMMPPQGAPLETRDHVRQDRGKGGWRARNERGRGNNNRGGRGGRFDHHDRNRDREHRRGGGGGGGGNKGRNNNNNNNNNSNNNGNNNQNNQNNHNDRRDDKHDDRGRSSRSRSRQRSPKHTRHTPNVQPNQPQRVPPQAWTPPPQAATQAPSQLPAPPPFPFASLQLPQGFQWPTGFPPVPPPPVAPQQTGVAINPAFFAQHQQPQPQQQQLYQQPQQQLPPQQPQMQQYLQQQPVQQQQPSAASSDQVAAAQANLANLLRSLTQGQHK